MKKLILISLLVLTNYCAASTQTETLAPYLTQVYGEQLGTILNLKTNYAKEQQLITWADYSLINRPVQVEYLPHTPFTRRIQKAGHYEPQADKITFYGMPDSNTKLHELSHALQRVQAMAYAEQKKSPTNEQLMVALNGKTLDYRLTYLMSQTELEVRLMQLNRAFYMANKRPILSQQDALEALVGAGMKISKRVAKDLGLTPVSPRNVTKFQAPKDVKDFIDFVSGQEEAYDKSAYLPAVKIMITLAPALL